jgi:hypothetical protein
MQFLQTIVDKGLRKSMKDVWVINVQKFPDPSLARIWEFFQPAQVIVWGCQSWMNTQQLNIELHKQVYVSGSELLQANTLSSYVTDAQSKAKLWLALQRMFFN